MAYANIFIYLFAEYKLNKLNYGDTNRVCFHFWCVLNITKFQIYDICFIIITLLYSQYLSIRVSIILN